MSQSFPELNARSESVSVESTHGSDSSFHPYITHLMQASLEQPSPLSASEVLEFIQFIESHPQEFRSQEKDIAKFFLTHHHTLLSPETMASFLEADSSFSLSWLKKTAWNDLILEALLKADVSFVLFVGQDGEIHEKLLLSLSRRTSAQNRELNPRVSHFLLASPEIHQFSYLKTDLEYVCQRGMADPSFVNGVSLDEYRTFLSHAKDEIRKQLVSGLIVHKQLENYPIAMQCVCRYVLDDRMAYELLSISERYRVAQLLFVQKVYLHALSSQTDIGSLVSLFRYHFEQEIQHQKWSSEKAFLYFWSFVSSATGEVKATLFSLFSAYIKQGYFSLEIIFDLLERKEIRSSDFFAWIESDWALAKGVLADNKKRCIKFCPTVELMYQSSDCDVDTFVQILCHQKDERQQRRMLNWRHIMDSEISAITSALIAAKGGRGFLEFVLSEGAHAF